MLIWLGGTGRSDAELERLIQESKRDNADGYRNRRTFERISIDDADGKLIYRDSKVSCRILDISEGGCSLQVEKPFRHGALAPVEIVLPILGMVLHIAGITQWIKQERRIGVRFTHGSSKSKIQMESLMSCLLGQRTVESVKESVASYQLNMGTGDVLAVSPPMAPSAPPHSTEGRLSYDSLIHGDENILFTDEKGKCPVTVRFLDGCIHFHGVFVDLSRSGCTVRTAKPFIGEIQAPIEVEFELHGMRFLIGGVTQAIYDAHSIGVRFDMVSRRRREGLDQLIEKLCKESHVQLNGTQL